jgi:hypothetical protein
MKSHPDAIFLSGPIGVGKSTLGQSLAKALGARFVEGDEHALDEVRWFACSLRTHRSILAEVVRNASEGHQVVVAYPLRCIEWIFHKRHLVAAGLTPVFVSLWASYDVIVHASRGRSFSEWERCRIQEMIEQGYRDRPFSDLVLNSGSQGIDTTVGRLVHELQEL